LLVNKTWNEKGKKIPMAQEMLTMSLGPFPPQLSSSSPLSHPSHSPFLPCKQLLMVVVVVVVVHWASGSPSIVPSCHCSGSFHYAAHMVGRSSHISYA